MTLRKEKKRKEKKRKEKKRKGKKRKRKTDIGTREENVKETLLREENILGELFYYHLC